jgi:hypothetical protein
MFELNGQFLVANGKLSKTEDAFNADITEVKRGHSKPDNPQVT